jgi:hypothetical protein
MPFPVPQIDHRTHRQLVTEALDRVRYHTPEWTNLQDSDPGVTLVQLFAFFTESLNYRANLIPERNRAKFLRLLGVRLRPAAAARGLVAFSNPRGPLTPVTLAAEREVLAGRVPFRTENALTVLPIEGKLYYKAKLDEARKQEIDELYRRLYEDQLDGVEPDYYETRAFETPAGGVTLPDLDLSSGTADGALWLALLARPGERPEDARTVIAHEILTLGVLPALDETSAVLPPGGEPAPGRGGAGLVFQVPRAEGDGVRWERLEARPSSDLVTEPGTVELRLPAASHLVWQEEEDFDPLESGLGELPPSLADADDGERLITWIRIRAPQGARQDGATNGSGGGGTSGNGGSGGGLQTRLSGVWVHAAEVVQRAWVSAEQLPSGTGEPDQSATLVHTPVLPETLRLSVGGELWQPIDDLAAAAPEVVPRSPRLAAGAATSGNGRQGGNGGTTSGTETASKVYTLGPESGEIRFGDGAHGTRPPLGAAVVAAYAYGGGREGVVGIGSITKGTDLPAGLKVTNPAPTWGGDEAETLGDAEHRIPRYLRHRDRLVAEEDFQEIVWSTPGVDLGRVEVLPLFHPQMPEVPAAGVVTLLLIPHFDPEHPDNPEPDRLFLEAVCRHLDPRRLVTTELHLRGPDYQDVWVSAAVEVLPGREQGPVLEQVEIEIRRFLSPLAGGFEGRGWPLVRGVEAAEVQAVVTRVPGVSKTVALLLGDPTGAEVAEIAFSGLELPRLAGVSVSAGEAVPLDDLRGEPGADAGAAGAPVRLPVPVIPEEC